MIFLILFLVGRLLFKASWKELRFLFPSSCEGSLVKCCFQLLDDIFLKLKINELKIDVPFFDPDCVVLHWIDSVCCHRCHRRRRCCRRYFFIYLFVGSFDDPERGGELSFRKLDAIERQEFYYKLLLNFLAKAFNPFLDFWQRILNSEIWHPQRLLNYRI